MLFTCMERPLYDSSRLKDFAAMGSILEERVRDVSTNEMLHSIARRKERDCGYNGVSGLTRRP